MQKIFALTAIALVGCCGFALAQSHNAPAIADTSKAQVKQSLKGFVGNISNLTEKNSDFRHVLYTGKNLQLVLMSLKPGEDIGEEVHDNVDQFFRIEEGSGEVIINGHLSSVKSEDAIVVPAGARHNLEEYRDETAQALHALCASATARQNRPCDQARSGSVRAPL